MNIASVGQLSALRASADLDSVTLSLTSLLRGNLPQYAVRYAMWALRQGGHLTIHAPTTIDSVSLAIGRCSFQLLTQLVAKTARDLGTIIEWDLPRRSMTIQRNAPVLAPGPWSAAIVYSGHANEQPQLEQCIEHLLRQPEIRAHGEILICGPAESRSALPHSARSLQFVPVETQRPAGRFLIGAKKMQAIRAMTNERVLICHTRIALREECLVSLPREFDVITPQVWIRGQNAALPYLDLGFFDNRSTLMFSFESQPPIHYDRRSWLQHLSRQYPYVDGGLVCVRRSLALMVPMSEAIAWGEGEDAEWSLRLLSDGKLVELSQQAHADSMTIKTARYARWGHTVAYRMASRWQAIARRVVAPMKQFLSSR